MFMENEKPEVLANIGGDEIKGYGYVKSVSPHPHMSSLTESDSVISTGSGGGACDPDPDTIKMFVGQIPRHWNEPECRKLFEKYGPVYSLNILRDKVSQSSKGCCFVTYYHRKDAIAAQCALHNIETIDGMHHPVQMKPADTENRNERKLFIGQLSKKHSEDDVRSLFARFGHIEDCSVLRDSDGRSRGCAFVTFSTRNCAVNATKEMHHSQTMEGCTAPLVVKFADTQKDKDTKSRTPTIGGGGGGGSVLSGGHQVSSAGTPLTALGQQAALLQQLGGGAGAINLQTLTALASLLQGGGGGQQQNMLGLLGGVLSALGKLATSPTGEAPPTSGTAANGVAAAAAGVASQASHRQQLGLLQQHAAHLQPQQQQNLDALAQLQQAQIAQQQQQQQLLALLGHHQQAAEAQAQANNLAAYQQYQGAHVVSAATSSAAAANHYAASVHQPVYQTATGMMQPSVAAASLKTASPVGAALQSPVMAHLSDPLQQAMQQYALTSALHPGMATVQVSAAAGVGNGDVKGPDGSNLFIYHLPQDFGDTDLMSTFSPFGTVLSAKVFIDKVTNLSKCFGFVSYDNALSAQNAIAAMNGFKIGTKRLKVQLKNERSHPYTVVA